MESVYLPIQAVVGGPQDEASAIVFHAVLGTKFMYGNSPECLKPG